MVGPIPAEKPVKPAEEPEVEVPRKISKEEFADKMP